MGYDMYVDFSKGEKTLELNCFFNTAGVMGMIEAKDYDKIDMVSPFMGAIVDRLYGLDHVATTSSYVRYVKVIYAINR